ncbi:hypothetical protein BH11BAC5_BH11BAC5_29930 [soil metagenome]
MTSGSLVVNIVDSFSKTENNHSEKSIKKYVQQIETIKNQNIFWRFAFSRPLFALSLPHLALGFPRSPFSAQL